MKTLFALEKSVKNLRICFRENLRSVQFRKNLALKLSKKRHEALRLSHISTSQVPNGLAVRICRFLPQCPGSTPRLGSFSTPILRPLL